VPERSGKGGRKSARGGEGGKSEHLSNKFLWLFEKALLLRGGGWGGVGKRQPKKNEEDGSQARPRKAEAGKGVQEDCRVQQRKALAKVGKPSPILKGDGRRERGSARKKRKKGVAGRKRSEKRQKLSLSTGDRSVNGVTAGGGFSTSVRCQT